MQKSRSLENAGEKVPGSIPGGNEEGAHAEDDKDDKNEDNECEMRMNLKSIKWKMKMIKDEDDKE